MIEIRHLGKTFRTTAGDIVALDDINLTIDDGEIFGIIGLSGAGKSTLVRCINLLERPTCGAVIIDGQDITALPEKELLKLRKSIGMIFQGFNLLEQRTVMGNVCFPLEISGIKKKEAQAKALELLKIVGLEDRVKSYPSQLSGGQKQRVAIARALATDPKYLLCDEATSALDPNTTRQILDLLKRINTELKVTIVVITHEMKVIDRISTAGGRKIRLTFDGEQKTNDPLISRMVLECGAPVNILFADTRVFEGVVYGHMVIELPAEEREAEKLTYWLSSNNVKWKEEI